MLIHFDNSKKLFYPIFEQMNKLLNSSVCFPVDCLFFCCCFFLPLSLILAFLALENSPSPDTLHPSNLLNLS